MLFFQSIYNRILFQLSREFFMQLQSDVKTKLEDNKAKLEQSTPSTLPKNWKLIMGDVNKLDDVASTEIVVFEKEVDWKNKKENQNDTITNLNLTLANNSPEPKNELFRIVITREQEHPSSSKPIVWYFCLTNPNTIKSNSDMLVNRVNWIENIMHFRDYWYAPFILIDDMHNPLNNERNAHFPIASYPQFKDHVLQPDCPKTSFFACFAAEKFDADMLTYLFMTLEKQGILKEEELDYFSKIWPIKAPTHEETLLEQNIHDACKKENYDHAIELSHKLHRMKRIKTYEGPGGNRYLDISRSALTLAEDFEKANLHEQALKSLKIFEQNYFDDTDTNTDADADTNKADSTQNPVFPNTTYIFSEPVTVKIFDLHRSLSSAPNADVQKSRMHRRKAMDYLTQIQDKESITQFLTLLDCHCGNNPLDPSTLLFKNKDSFLKDWPENSRANVTQINDLFFGIMIKLADALYDVKNPENKMNIENKTSTENAKKPVKQVGEIEKVKRSEKSEKGEKKEGKSDNEIVLSGKDPSQPKVIFYLAPNVTSGNSATSANVSKAVTGNSSITSLDSDDDENEDEHGHGHGHGNNSSLSKLGARKKGK